MLLGKLVEVRGSFKHLLFFVSDGIRVSPHVFDGHNAHGYRYRKSEELLHAYASQLAARAVHTLFIHSQREASCTLIVPQ